MKRKLSVIMLSCLTAFTAVATASGALAWFRPTGTIDSGVKPIDGQTDGAYFAYGNGSISGEGDRPYGISKPHHLYNLAWLQYLGFYKDKQVYFELADNIDMTGWKLPPIGTEQYPFIGNFNGQGYVISNLTVSNDFDTDLTRHPGVVDSEYFNTETLPNDNYPNIVGFFGVVGNYANPSNKNTIVSYNSSINSIKNFGLKGITVKTQADNTLVGALAGYASGTIFNVAVDATTINIKSGAQALTNGPTTKLSDHSIVGYTTNTKTIRKVNETIYDVNVTRYDEFNVPDSGDSVGWGGSMNMLDLYTRLNAVRDRNTFANSTPTFTYRDYVARGVDGIESPSQDSDVYQGGYLKTYVGDSGYGTYSIFDNGTDDDDTYNYMYLMGGKNKITSSTEYYIHSHITDGNNNFLHCANVRDGGAITNRTVADDTTLTWVIPSKTGGKIYTVKGNNKFYLKANNDLSLTLTANESDANGTYWKRDDREENQVLFVRFTVTIDGVDYYLKYDSGWVLSTFPEIPPNIGVEPQVPPAEPKITDPKYSMDGYMNNGNQIYYVNEDTKLYMSDTFHASDAAGQISIFDKDDSYFSMFTDLSKGWYFSRLQSGRTTTISFNSTNSNYIGTTALGLGIFADYKHVLTFGNNSANFTATSEGTNLWSFSISLANRVAFGGNSTWYLTYNNGYVQLSKTKSIFFIKATNQIMTELFNEDYAQYAIVKNEYDKWETSTQTYDSEYSTYLQMMDETYAINRSVNSEVIGPDTYEDINNPSNDKMVYDSTNTSYIPLNVEQDGTYSSVAAYAPKKTNTGYIVASSNMNANSAFNAGLSTIRVAKYPQKIAATLLQPEKSYIDKSFYDGNLNVVYTIDSNGTHTISEKPGKEGYDESQSAYKKYGKTFKDFETKLQQSDNKVYGLHFEDARISKDNCVIAPSVVISNEKNAESTNKTYTNYAMPVNSIDFNLSERGYINFFAGAYINNDANVDSFFSIHQIIRDDDNNIIDIKEIQAVYSDDEETHSYIFQYKDAPIQFSYPYIMKNGVRYKLALNGEQTYEQSDLYELNSTMSSSLYTNYKTRYSYKMVFNTDWITNYDNNGNRIKSILNSYIYYFELPVNEGEYCLGSVQNGLGAYLLYLDIAANASRTQRTQTVEHFFEDVYLYKIPVGVAYSYMPSAYSPGTGQHISAIDEDSGEVVTSRDITLDDKNTVCVSLNVGYSGDFIVNRTATDSVSLIRAVTASAIPNYQGEKVISFTDSSGQITNIDYFEHTTYEIFRLRHYDYSASSEDWTMTEITDTVINGNQRSREILQYKNFNIDGPLPKPETDTSNIYVYYLTTVGDVQVVRKYNNPMDFNELVISGYSSNVLIDCSTYQDVSSNESGYSDEYNLNLVLDTSVQDKYYLIYANFEFEINQFGDMLVVKIKDGDNILRYEVVNDGTITITISNSGIVVNNGGN